MEHGYCLFYAARDLDISRVLPKPPEGKLDEEPSIMESADDTDRRNSHCIVS